MKPSSQLAEIPQAGSESAGLGLHERKVLHELLRAECSSSLSDDYHLETRGLPDDKLLPKENVQSLARSVGRDLGKDRT